MSASIAVGDTGAINCPYSTYHERRYTVTEVLPGDSYGYDVRVLFDGDTTGGTGYGFYLRELTPDSTPVEPEAVKMGDRVEVSTLDGRAPSDATVVGARGTVSFIRAGVSGAFAVVRLDTGETLPERYVHRFTKIEDYKVGDRVIVDAEAKTSRGGGVFFHTETTGEVVRGGWVTGGDVCVRAPRSDGEAVEQAVAPWHLRLAPEVVEPEPVVTFEVGQRVRINTTREELAQWHGHESRVIRVSSLGPLLQPLTPRPDGYGLASFYWSSEEVEVIGEPEPEPKDVEGDLVAHPSHYTGHPKGIEAIAVIEDAPNYNLGAALKYIWRVSWGSKGNDVQDLQKAKQYIDFEIARRGRLTEEVAA